MIMELGRLAPLLDDFDRRMRDPLQLRLGLGVLLVAAWYFLVYSPQSEQIAATERDRAQLQAHVALARTVADLRAEAEKVRGHIPERGDTNEWIESILDGVRRFPLKVRKLEPLAPRAHGPYTALSAKLELVGHTPALDGLLGWVEANPRLLRIDTITLEPDQGEKALVLRITVIGIVG